MTIMTILTTMTIMTKTIVIAIMIIRTTIFVLTNFYRENESKVPKLVKS